MNRLSDAIWVTRKCHINAAERLNRLAFFANLLLTLYSIYLVVAALIALKITLPDFEIVSLIGAVLTLAASVFIWGLRFSERSAEFKASYIRLQELHNEATDAESTNNAAALTQCRHSYSDVLRSCENHNSMDFLHLRFELRNSASKTVASLSQYDYFRYFGSILVYAVLKIIASVSPALALYWYVRCAH